MSASITSVMDCSARRNRIFYSDNLLPKRKDATLIRHIASVVHQKFHFLFLSAYLPCILELIGVPFWPPTPCKSASWPAPIVAPLKIAGSVDKRKKCSPKWDRRRHGLRRAILPWIWRPFAKVPAMRLKVMATKSPGVGAETSAIEGTAMRTLLIVRAGPERVGPVFVGDWQQAAIPSNSAPAGSAAADRSGSSRSIKDWIGIILRALSQRNFGSIAARKFGVVK